MLGKYSYGVRWAYIFVMFDGNFSVTKHWLLSQKSIEIPTINFPLNINFFFSVRFCLSVVRWPTMLFFMASLVQ